MKTSELTGEALDWAVAKCEGATNLCYNPHRFCEWLICDFNGTKVFMHDLGYSSEWKLAGPIIDREGIAMRKHRSGTWYAMTSLDLGDFEGARWVKETYKGCEHGEERRACRFTGTTPLVAAMRCYVASKLGNEVDVPEVFL